MPFSDPQARQNASAQGPMLETVLCSEVTLVPFPPGVYRIAVGSMEHPAKTVANTAFPAMQVTVLPGCFQVARLDTADGTTAWLDRVGGQTLLRVAAPGGLVLFTAYRPHDYPTTGIRMDVERIKQPEAPGFPQAPSFPQTPGFPQAQPYAQPAAFQQPGAFQNPASPQGFSLTPPASGGFPAAGGGFSQPQFPAQGFQPQPFQPSPGAGFLGGQAPGGFGAANPGFRPAAPQPFSQQQPFSPQATPRPQQAAPITPAAPTPSDASVPGIRMAGHIEMEGDKAFEPGQTAGVPGSGRRLEAVALYAEGLNLHELEYAAVSRDGHLLPWVCPPQFTGSRGMGAPLIGFAARLSGEAAARYDIVYSGSFFQGGQAEPVGNGEFLKSPVQGDALESLRVTLTPKKA